MKKIHRVFALLMAAIMALSLITTAFAEPTIDPSKKASLSIYKYDITKASSDGAWDAESYVSTGLHDDAVVDKLAKYALQGVEFTYLRVADVTMSNEVVDDQRTVGVLYGFDGSDRSNAVLSAIIGNCDTLLFLGGGNEPTSLEFVSKLLGKETVHTRTRGQTKGRSGSSSVNYQQTGRDLMTPDEIRMLPTNDALLFIRGELPVCDDKFDIMTHPLVSHTPDGGAPPYIHGSAEYAIAAITIHDRLLPTDPVAVPSENETQYELLSNEELEAIYELEEKPNEASQKH